MMFDLAPLMEELAANYRCEVVAQSSTHVYTLDLCYEDTVLLRLWDTYYLEMGGLAAMGAPAASPRPWATGITVWHALPRRP